MNIKASTLDFLRELRENNSREWFNEHKASYELAYADVRDFVEALIQHLSRFDPNINEDIKASKCMFRIYRDVRFSKDKSPYKSWLAAGISVDGRKLDGPEYYIHIEPGKTFIAVGYWLPKKEHLEAIRQEIDYNYPEFIEVLKQGGWDLEDLSTEDKLVRPPAGYSMDNEAIEVLKLKSFIIFKHLSEEEITHPFALEKIIEVFQRTLPFKNFIHEAIDL